MGDGKKLKEVLDRKNTNVRQVAKATGISATTLYSIIQRDTDIRLDFAVRLANELGIDVNEICSQKYIFGQNRIPDIQNLFCREIDESETESRKFEQAKKDFCDWVMSLSARKFFELSSVLEDGNNIPEGILYSCSECQKEYDTPCDFQDEIQCFRLWCRHYGIRETDETEKSLENQGLT